MRFFVPPLVEQPGYAAVNDAYRMDEATAVRRMSEAVGLDAARRERVAGHARRLVAEARRRRTGASPMDAFMQEYDLSSGEGVALMCLAEALLRIPDDPTVDLLIRDKVGAADWALHRDASDSLFVNASTWALMLTGRLASWHDAPADDPLGALQRMVERTGEPFVRGAVTSAMRVLGRQFVMGRTIHEALDRARDEEHAYRHSFDMLGEAARSAADARRYLERYLAAVEAVGRAAAGAGAGPVAGPGISVKLSALHPRFEPAQGARVRAELLPRLRRLALAAARHDIGLTIDAEEASRLDLTLDVLAALCDDPELAGWGGLGIAVQAYQKRGYHVIGLLASLARARGRRLMVRLVKGAYWDTEVKAAQVKGLEGYPVFTRKVNTDVSYLACARRLLDHREVLYPQFATHNAHTAAAVLELAGPGRGFELQRLHGMGRALHDQLLGGDEGGVACRAYDPVGSHEELLPYLVRRLLENGANTSFVNRIRDEGTPVAAMAADPVRRAAELGFNPHPRIPLPRDLYRPDRLNARGVDLSDTAVLRRLAGQMADALAAPRRAAPVVGGRTLGGEAEAAVTDPADRRRRVGTVVAATREAVDAALAQAGAAAPGWDATAAGDRAAALEATAAALEEHLGELVALCAREAGRPVADGVAEVREAADFCRYYAARAREAFGAPRELPGPTGERNTLALHGRGVFACISPWNFPLAIFTGQVAAALAAGNAVAAKPAAQTPLTAARAVEIFHQAGVPPEVLHLLPGGPDVGEALVRDRRVAGVAFTGGVATARAINRTLAGREGPIVPLIAETGGQNAMVVDSSALTEQVVADVVASAFQSAGQRCSALRVLYVQEDAAEPLLELLAGAMAELVIGDPWDLATDVGPVIDEPARQRLVAHERRMEGGGRLIHRCALPEATRHGTFFAPQAWEIEGIGVLEGEVFGPILHVVRYPAGQLDGVIGDINATGFGLTFGVHSRIDATIGRCTAGVRAGNAYANRSMIGSVVGVQPFGGEGLSGTGPKAGGPHYLPRFAVERTVTVDTTAAGGNASLMTLEDDGA